MKLNTEIQPISFLFIAMFIAFLVSTITVQFLWNWFIVPVGVKELSFVHSSGLVLIIDWIKSSNAKPTYKLLVTHIIKSVVVLAIGFIIVNVAQ